MNFDERLNMPLNEAIFSLRAIRKFSNKPVSEGDISSILNAAIQAPNGGNQQPWRFLVIRNTDLISQLAILYKEAWWAKRQDVGINGPQDVPKENLVMQSAMGLADAISHAPVIVMVCSTSRGSKGMGSVIPSVQNMLLAARSLGIGGTITTLHGQVESRVHRLFGIPDTAQVVYCIPLGYPKGRFGPVTRKPLNNVAAYDRWDGEPLRVSSGMFS
ncbi:hypothetical protein FIM12_03290 [SAR202 cluster bacterium AD-804-J14_MRT_500m]|nr:hypothetical protein [SAR202 cluster bacterium AD-804-J14_MRT_500m]